MADHKNKPRLHDIRFDPEQQPGHDSRYKSLDSLGGQDWPWPMRIPTFNSQIVRDNSDKTEKFKSMQSDWVNPQRLLRKKGYNPF